MRKDKIEISEYGLLLMYKNGYTSEFVERTIKQNKLNGLRIWTDPMDNPPLSLGFLEQFSFLEALDVSSLYDYEFRFLQTLAKLKKLSIYIYKEGKNEINLSNQTNLEDLTIQWRKGKIKGLEHCRKLTTICLVEYKEADFLPICDVKQLEHLIVKTASIKTLNGINELENLESILLGYCPSLRSIKALNGSRNLKSLEINLCTKIQDYDSLTDLPNLRSLTLTNCRSIDSIEFIRNFPSLESIALVGNTNVHDGNLLPVQHLKEYFFSPQKHYNLKMDYAQNRK